ncbi:MAG: NAD(P)/FAD-dependent oxidoreductase [Gemmatimonadaceae bacterium]|nr:NAD(P)/FAD-dependent oxidoreductase [Gemmatimonadaceae bacterium]
MTARPRVVIIGGGFAGLHAARALRRAPVDVTLVDRTNHHVFQPLLYQVANTSLAPSDIAAPIRWILRAQRNVTVLLGEVLRIDPHGRRVEVAGYGALAYDALIVATGSRHAYFGHSEWEPHAPGLKTLEDALDLRERLLLAFERAEWTTDEAERRALLTFVVVGGGPTGVELAGTLPEFARAALRPDFRRYDAGTARVMLVEGGARLLPSFPESVSASARRDLERLGVEVRTGAVVTDVDARGVNVGNERIDARTVFWAAGNAASPLGRVLEAPVDRAGRVLVSADLSVPGHPEIFVAGDLAAVRWDETRWVPGVAPAAMQMGRLAGRNAECRLRGQSTAPFRYLDKGEMATIGRNKAVAVFGRRFSITGRPAWFFWLFVHIMYLVGFRNRLSVLLQWAYAYFTFQRGVRLVTSRDAARPAGGLA